MLAALVVEEMATVYLGAAFGSPAELGVGKCWQEHTLLVGYSYVKAETEEHLESVVVAAVQMVLATSAARTGQDLERAIGLLVRS
jgi:hypothetical protein